MGGGSVKLKAVTNWRLSGRQIAQPRRHWRNGRELYAPQQGKLQRTDGRTFNSADYVKPNTIFDVNEFQVYRDNALVAVSLAPMPDPMNVKKIAFGREAEAIVAKT